MAKVKLLDPTDQKRRLDRYELIGELAAGGMATVYLARIGGVGGFQRFVAIKRLHPHLAHEEEFIEMFLDEARLAAGIHHPHVVPILEVGQSDAGYYLVMEYIEGDTLARIVARALSGGRPVPRAILLRVILDALSGLHAAHELCDPLGNLVNLIHRDCSPQNILVGVDGCSRITDFGVAHATSRLANTRTDRVKGKLAYMSPEQAQGDTELDRRADLFAMGVILWEVLAGRRLFKADTDQATLKRVLAEPIPRLSRILGDVHPALDDAVARSLERDPDRRYQTAAEMADTLERAAREAAAASPNELGVASPREVAGYVQSALGQDMAAQRESVRAWLAHSEPTGGGGPARPAVKPDYDTTVKVPMERQAEPSESLPIPLAKVSMTGDRPALELVPDLDDGTPDADEHDTLLMQRDGPLAQLLLPPSSPGATTGPSQRALAAAASDLSPRPSGEFLDPTPIASSGHVEIPMLRSRGRGIAIAAALLLLLGGAALWFGLQPAPGGPATASTGSPVPPPEPRPSASSPPPLPSIPATAEPPPPSATVSAAPKPPSGPVSPPAHGGRPPATAKTGAPKQPPPGGGEDLANPYR